MKTWLKVLLIVLASLVTLFGLFLAAGAFFTSDLYEDIEALHGGTLTSYTYSEGGDMNGSSYYERIAYDGEGQVIRKVSESSWWGDDGTVTEYLLDSNVMEEIESVFRKHMMFLWNGKNLSTVFVADGSTMSYSFGVGGEDFSFYSQMIPSFYGKKLSQIDDVIEKYMAAAERLPGLIRPETEESDPETSDREPVDGEVSFRVYRYAGTRLECRLLNGTEEDVTVTDVFTLTRADTGEEVPQEEQDWYFEYTACPYDCTEMTVYLVHRLDAGNYILTCGDYTAEFEIG